ncbi:MAG TPA: hypothetical protein VGH26_06320 [Gaiellaceae bacterium]|jgi:hypothetical protein
MKRRIAVAAIAAATLAALAAVQIAGATGSSSSDVAGCQLGGLNKAANIQHVIYLQFDNTHYNRDNPNVASDLEQMPHLLSFLEGNGTLFTNDHTILISHTAGGILTSLTGLYPDRNGQTVSNSYDYFPASKTPAFTSSFKYWTNPVDPVNNTLPNMITDGQKTTPAPWVPFTRAGCDVGGVGTANIELENNGTNATGDITQVFGNGSSEWNETVADPQQGLTDFVGIAIHCSQNANSVCNGNSNAKADQLPDEPNSYTGFSALYGSKYVDPAITNGNPCVNDTSGQPITDPRGFCGFPGFDGMLAKNTLGYVAQMQENGVPVTYGYISDAHDLHVPVLSSDSYSSSATGPGELAHEQQLKDYDTAFENFFLNLKQHGITRKNTLFVITVDEGDHFAGGVGAPQPGGDWLTYNHTTCTTPTFPNCPSSQIGEVGANIKGLVTAADSGATTSYDIHPDDAPTFYVNGQPARTDTTVRRLERDVGGLTAPDPYVRNGANQPQTVPLTVSMADPVEEKTLHMVNADPSRTPTFTMFGNPDYFFSTSNPCSGTPLCVTPGFAWNHGDVQPEIGNTWVGMVGPGVANNGVNSTTWTDHTNLRPTVLSLVGLHDDYTDDGHVLVQALDVGVTPQAMKGQTIADLEAAQEQVNAPFGQFADATLAASTRAIKSTDDNEYNNIEDSITSLTGQRDALVAQIRSALNDATFNGTTIPQSQAQSWINQANSLISQAQALPH